MYKRVIILSTIVLVFILIIMDISCKVSPGDKEVAVGNKNFTEQYIIGELIKQLLEDRGFIVDLKSGSSTSCLREGMEFGDIDIYAEYTGTAWMVHLAHEFNAGVDNNEVKFSNHGP